MVVIDNVYLYMFWKQSRTEQLLAFKCISLKNKNLIRDDDGANNWICNTEI